MFITGFEIFRFGNRRKHICPSCRTLYDTPKIQRARGFALVMCPKCGALIKRVKLQKPKR